MDICIIGGGISGVSAASIISNIAKKNNKKVNITLFEKSERLGGSVYTKENNGFRIEAGPNGFLNNKTSTLNLFKEANLSNLLIKSNDASRIRYIYKDNKLVKLPEKPIEFLKSDILSLKGKLRVLGEFFVPKKKDNYDETIADFAERRLGKEAKDYLIAPMVSGVFAGDISKLSLKASFPTIYELEKDYGGLFKGLFKKKDKKSGPSGPKSILISCKGGLYNGLIALSEQNKHLDLKLNEEVISIDNENKISVNTTKNNYNFDKIILTIPAYNLSNVIKGLDSELSYLFSTIKYAPACVVGLGFSNESLPDPLKGFGFLIPPKENKKILGILFTSSIFPERAPDNHKLIRIILGGDGNEWILQKNTKELIELAYSQAKDILKIKGKPIVEECFLFEKAIPQYYVGHYEKVKKIENILNKYNNIYIGGNILYGISMNDCTAQSYKIAEKIFKEV
ncbi:MAG: protoporphyrinogen oxidase [Deferribacterota bacterium]|nr:protoporphyrinogen oxidase [Deferribacterota bacterium]